MIHPLNAVDQQLVRLAHAAKAQRDQASQHAFEADIQPLITHYGLAGQSVTIVDHEGGLALEVA